VYLLIDKQSHVVLGRFENLTAARGTLLDFFRLHPPAARWLEVVLEPEQAKPQLLEAA